MLTDVFYFGSKPNVHPRERFADNLAHARQLSTTDHFWIINEYCDYRNFDFDWDFDFLPDEDVWSKDYNNVFPSQHQKDSGTWLCPKNDTDVIIYRTDVEPVYRKNEINDRWVVNYPLTNDFDYSWHPDTTEPPFIYMWGNKYVPREIKSTVEYHVPGATQIKYMDDVINIEPDTCWKVFDNVDTDKFDMSWRPDPREPAFIYVWGNKYINGELQPTLEYHCENAIDRKYMQELVPLLPNFKNIKELIKVDRTKFDISWRPDPREPAFIYVWGNQWNSPEVEPTFQYTVDGATQVKYMNEIAHVLPTKENWETLIPVEDFDYSWRPHPNSPPYKYVWGNQWNDCNKEPTVVYTVPGATEINYITDTIARVKKSMTNWEIVIPVTEFDFSWRPDPYDPPFIYVFGNMFNDSETEPTVLYKMKDATEYKFMSNIVASTKVNMSNWIVRNDKDYELFDFSWRPNPKQEASNYVWGTDGPIYNMDSETIVEVEYDRTKLTAKTKITETIKQEFNRSMFYVDRANKQSNDRFVMLKQRFPQLQKTRYLSSWVETISRCTTKSDTELFWVLSSEVDYSEFLFDYNPNPWQMKMVHVFGTQWSHWGNTYMANKNTFNDNTKYVKVIEHLNILNFVKDTRAKVTECQHDIILIDHGNNNQVCELLTNKTNRSVSVLKYTDSYLNTFKMLLDSLETKKEHYVWVCSSICDYSNFDFTYIPDPYAKQQLHVFPSNQQKFGDTFLIDVNKLKETIDTLDRLEEFDKVNYNNHQRVNRLPSPVFTVEDSQTDLINVDFDFPYAVFKSSDNLEDIVDNEPMNIWEQDKNTILITKKGASRIIVPKHAKDQITNEVYDYPYIDKVNLSPSNPLDIVFLSNGEKLADEHYDKLLSISKKFNNRVVRVDGVNGRANAYHAAAQASNTPWFFTVFAKLDMDTDFDFNWQPDRLQARKHYIFNCVNPVNHLVYGHQALIVYNKKLVLNNPGIGLDFTLDDLHEVVDINSGVARFNTDEYSTWRTSFRECIKLCHAQDTMSKERLKIWSTVAEGDFAQSSLQGAKDAVEYYESVNGDFEKLKLSYDWEWLKELYNK